MKFYTSQSMTAVQDTVDHLLFNNAKKATKYISDKLVVKATIHGKHRKGSNYHIVLSIGTPNWQERRFIRACKQAGEPFPVKRVQLKCIAKKR